MDAFRTLNEVRRTPRRLWNAGLHLTQAALDNAQRGHADIAASRSARTELREQLENGHRAGDLVRLSTEECLDVLRDHCVGRLAFNARVGHPDLTVVNYAMMGRDLVIQSGPGPKLDAARRREPVAFEVDDVDVFHRTARTVVVIGELELLEPHEPAIQLPDRWARGPRTHLMRIRTRRIEGRHLVGTPGVEPAEPT